MNLAIKLYMYLKNYIQYHVKPLNTEVMLCDIKALWT